MVKSQYSEIKRRGKPVTQLSLEEVKSVVKNTVRNQRSSKKKC